jgi:hypothetical protein
MTSIASPSAALQTEAASFHKPNSKSIGPRRLLPKPGLEVALFGVDGAGKTSVATALCRLPYPVKVIAMGSVHFRWLSTLQKILPWPGLQLAMHGERMWRRWLGFCLACCGWIVVYDRHPLEQLTTRPALLRHRINNCFFYLYGWRVDSTFWLTGDYQQIYERKQEFTPERLRSLDQKISDVLAYRHIDHLKVNVTEKNLEAVVRTIARQISVRYEPDSREQVETIPPYKTYENSDR